MKANKNLCKDCKHYVSYYNSNNGECEKNKVKFLGGHLPSETDGKNNCKYFDAKYINLGKLTIWWKIRVFLLAPLWFLSPSPDRKSWMEFKHGLIKHKCEYNYDKLIAKHGGYYECKHYGCNMVKPKSL